MRRFVVALILGWPALAGADEVFLKSGGRLSGQVVSEDARSIVLEVGPGRVTVKADSVLRIERGTSAISAFRERASRLAASDLEGWLSLAFWAAERDLGTQAHEALDRVLRLDPQNAAANAALGRVLSNGRYVTVDESYRERGYVQYEGEWITPTEQEARLRSRTAEEQATAARQEGALRVREAEAKARQAEAEARRAEAEAQAGSSTYGGIPVWGWGWGWGSPVVYPPVLSPPTTLVPPLRPAPRPTPLPPNPLSRPTNPSPPPPPPPQRARPRS